MTKGISPLVAVVMLIGITIGIGAIVQNAVTNFVTQYTQQQITSAQRCAAADAILQNGVYDASAKSLTIVIYNRGSVNLAFVPLLQYYNLSKHPIGIERRNNDLITVLAGEIKAYTLQNVDNDVEQVSIQSVKCMPPCYECPSAQDTLLRAYIKGL